MPIGSGLNSFNNMAGASITPAPNLSNMSYTDLLNANPYRNAPYRKSAWQNVLSALGFRTQADAYEESLALQAKEYEAQVLNKAYNEQYETPAAEASRMRTAGMNPDLLGLGDVEGASAPDLGDENPPIAPGDDYAPVMNFANTMMTALSTGLALAKGMGELANLGVVNRAGEITNINKVAQYADWVGKNFFLSPESWESMSVDPETGEEVPRKLLLFDDYFDAYGKNIPLKYQRQFKRDLGISLFSYGAANERYAKGIEYLANKKKYNWLRSEPTFAAGMSDETIQAVLKPLSKLSFEVEQTDLQFKKFQNEYQSKLYDPEKGLDPEAAAGAANVKNSYDASYWANKDSVAQAESENETALETSASQRFERHIHRCWREIISNLNELVDEGVPGATSMLLSFNMMHLAGQSPLFQSAAGALGKIGMKAILK